MKFPFGMPHFQGRAVSFRECNTSMTTSGEESVSLKSSCPNFKHLRIGPEDNLRLNPPSKKQMYTLLIVGFKIDHEWVDVFPT